MVTEGRRISEKLAALGTAAGASSHAVVMCFTIVAGEFFSYLDTTQGIKFCTFTEDPHKGVGCAGMIDKSKAMLQFGCINGFLIVDFDNGDVTLCLCSSSGFSLADSFSLKLTDFLSCLYGFCRKEPFPIDRTRFHNHFD